MLLFLITLLLYACSQPNATPQENGSIPQPKLSNGAYLNPQISHETFGTHGGTLLIWQEDPSPALIAKLLDANKRSFEAASMVGLESKLKANHESSVLSKQGDAENARSDTRSVRREMVDELLANSARLIKDSLTGLKEQTEARAKDILRTYCEAKLFEFAMGLSYKPFRFYRRPTPLSFCEPLFLEMPGYKNLKSNPKLLASQFCAKPEAPNKDIDYFECIWKSGVLESYIFKYFRFQKVDGPTDGHFDEELQAWFFDLINGDLRRLLSDFIVNQKFYQFRSVHRSGFAPLKRIRPPVAALPIWRSMLPGDLIASIEKPYRELNDRDIKIYEDLNDSIRERRLRELFVLIAKRNARTHYSVSDYLFNDPFLASDHGVGLPPLPEKSLKTAHDQFPSLAFDAGYDAIAKSEQQLQEAEEALRIQSSSLNYALNSWKSAQADRGFIASRPEVSLALFEKSLVRFEKEPDSDIVKVFMQLTADPDLQVASVGFYGCFDTTTSVQMTCPKPETVTDFSTIKTFIEFSELDFESKSGKLEFKLTLDEVASLGIKLKPRFIPTPENPYVEGQQTFDPYFNEIAPNTLNGLTFTGKLFINNPLPHVRLLSGDCQLIRDDDVIFHGTMTMFSVTNNDN